MSADRKEQVLEEKAMDAYAQGLIRKEQIEKYKDWLRNKK